MTHYIKILPEYFNAVATGRKSFEVRCNDRKYTVGDRLIMQEVDEHGRLLRKGGDERWKNRTFRRVTTPPLS